MLRGPNQIPFNTAYLAALLNQFPDAFFSWLSGASVFEGTSVPQCIHFSALSEREFPQSSNTINAIHPSTVFRIEDVNYFVCLARYLKQHYQGLNFLQAAVEVSYSQRGANTLLAQVSRRMRWLERTLYPGRVTDLHWLGSG